MNEALDLVRNMVLEAKSHYNDGWVMKGYEDDLKEVYRYLQKTFPEWERRKRKQNG
tara:strand:- start:109 stop:276 length:168 start_codon:yes stop_codon:yes gene_type:complete